MEHHKTLSPSAFPALSKCPCYCNITDDKVSSYAQDGLDKHKQLNDIFVTESINTKDIDVLYVYETITQNAIEIFKDEYSTITMYPEEKVYIYDDNLDEITFGTADLIIRSKTKCILFDAKFSMERDYYLQMAVYARGIMDRFGYDEITVFEVYGKLKKYNEYKITLKSAILATDEVINSVIDENKKPSKCDYCKWCSNIALCNESTVLINALVEQVGPQIKEKKLVPIDTSTKLSDPVEVGKLLDICRLILKPWCNTIEYVAKDMALNKNTPEGYKIQNTRGARSVSDIIGLFDKTALSQKDFLSCCEVNLTKLADKIGTTKKEFNKIVDEFCIRKEGSKKLVAKNEKEEELGND